MTAIHRSSGRHRAARRLTPVAAVTAVGLALAASALTSVPGAQAADPSVALQGQFAAASGEFHVPQSVLLALSYQETRWETHRGQPSTTGNYNVMGLTQVDVAAAQAAAAAEQPETDGRGDGTPAPAARRAPVTVVDSPALHTLDAAAGLIGRPAADLRSDSAQSIRGGAALLAKYQHDSGQATSADPGAWYGALVLFSQSPAANGGSVFADRVLGTVRSGATRVTDDGQQVTLAADPGLSLPRTGLAPRAVTPDNVECPAGLGCESAPAPGDNYSSAKRPSDGDAIQYIVIHDTEGGYAGSLKFFQDPSAGVSAHYLVRAGDGHVAQLVNTTDIAWHSGNKTFNMHSVGIEHEGYAFGLDAANKATWYSEQEYQASAALTKYLAGRFNIPLDRQHIIGHDDVPKPTELDSQGKPMPPQHWDPGTFWDWQHYMDLMGAPIPANTGGSLLVGGKVTITAPFSPANQPPVNQSADRPENFVYLRTAADPAAALINGGGQDASDVRDKAVAGSSYVVADQQGDWTAIWYGSQKAWFYNPNGQNGAADNRLGQNVLTPNPGVSSIHVYGRAFPDQSAYAGAPSGAWAPYQAPTPVNATVPAGQSYVPVSDTAVTGDFFYDGNPQAYVSGGTTYYPIRYDHRLAFLSSADVHKIPAVTPTPSGYTPAGPARLLNTRDTGSKVGPNSTISLQVAGADLGGGKTVPANVTAVVLNVTATEPTWDSYVAVYPDGQPRSTASNLNFTAGQTIPNLVVVPVINGKVDFYNHDGAVHLIADIMGYYSPQGTSKLSTAGPARLLDTRDSHTKVGPDSTISLQVAGADLGGGKTVPANVTAVVLNVTATEPTWDSYVAVYPDGQPRSTASNLNFTAGQTIPNLVVVPVINGKVDFYNHDGAVHLIADISGYYTPDHGSSFVNSGPARLLDSRSGIGGVNGKIGPGGVISLQVAGRSGLPANGVTAVVLNVTATDPTDGSYVAVYPDGQPRSTASNLNFTAGQTIPNLVVVPVINGKVDFYNNNGAVHLIADITGYYLNA